LAKTLGAQAWYLFMVIPTGRGEALLEELIAPADYQEILDWHYQIEKSEDHILLRPTCAPHYYRVRFQHNRKNKDREKPRSLSFSPGGGKGCLAGQSIGMVTATGELQACSYLPISAGNVKQKPIRDIWEESELLQNLRNFSAYKGRCGQCEFIKICGGCRARAYMMKGNYLAEEPFCDYQPLKALSSLLGPSRTHRAQTRPRFAAELARCEYGLGREVRGRLS
jgi:radical SAM protein with 4Fe4S-binding SPASM domain